MEKRRAINQYTCDTCARQITTVNAVDGVTPMFVMCKETTSGCHGTMISAMYRVHPHAVPLWEWYRPEGKELKKLIRKCPGWKEHVANGGLALRSLCLAPARRQKA